MSPTRQDVPDAALAQSMNSPLRGTSVLVTGGAGFIGSHITERLVEIGARVRVLDNMSTGRAENLGRLKDGIDLLVADVRDMSACRRACAGIDVVFHQAAICSVPRSMKDPAEPMEVNVAGTANILTAARDARVRRVVYASSSSVYGDSEHLPKREGEEGRPLSPYALSKCMNEQLADLFGRCFGLEAVGLRYFNIYGPRQDPSGPYGAVIPRLFAALLSGSPAIINGDGLQSRDFTFVADAVRANLCAAIAPSRACGRAYNVGAGQGTTICDLERHIRELAGGGPGPIFAPARDGDVEASLAATDAALAHLGFRAEIPLAEGLARSVRFYRGSLLPAVA